MTDLVNQPPHYKTGPVETIDIIEGLVECYPVACGYHVGNAVKYLSRAPHKGNLLQDLRKAEWYLKRAIQRIESEYAATNTGRTDCDGDGAGKSIKGQSACASG